MNIIMQVDITPQLLCGVQKYNLNPWSQGHAYIYSCWIFVIAVKERMGFTLQNFVQPAEF